MCAVPGNDGDQSISGVINTYYEGAASVSAGSTSVIIGAASGANEALAAGDLIVIIQMQDAQINSTNSNAYGSGGTSGRGYTVLNQTGRYEFAKVSSVIGSNVTLSEGLTYNYTNSNATSVRGQRRFQIIKVPQYNNLAISGTVTATAWDGRKGGVVAFDVANTLNGASGLIDVSGLGFRGGAHRRTGFAANSTTRSYYVDTEANNNSGTILQHSSKGEGIAGTPQYVYNGSTVVDTNGGSNSDGYPGGDYGRGAPGNAGGGGNEWSNAGNDSGGGSNVSTGGNGGAGWDLNPATQNVGGFGGASFPASSSRIVMGGGGGAGLANNTGQPHGGRGGGIVIVRANMVAGSLTINAAGANGVSSLQNDGGGGAGAGGSVVLTAASGLANVSVDVSGGQGGDADPSASGANDMHGPGGGGGGGYLAYTPGAGSPGANLAAGPSGTTTTRNETQSAANGEAGSQSSSAGRYPCAADLSVTKSDSLGDYQPGVSRSYSIVVTNNGPGDVDGAVVTDTVPNGVSIDNVSCSPITDCSSVSTSGQDIQAIVSLGFGDTLTITVDVTFSTLPEDY